MTTSTTPATRTAIIPGLDPATVELVAGVLRTAAGHRVTAARRASSVLEAEFAAGQHRTRSSGAIAIHEMLLEADRLEQAATAVDAAIAGGPDGITLTIKDPATPPRIHLDAGTVDPDDLAASVKAAMTGTAPAPPTSAPAGPSPMTVLDDEDPDVTVDGIPVGQAPTTVALTPAEVAVIESGDLGATEAGTVGGTVDPDEEGPADDDVPAGVLAWFGGKADTPDTDADTEAAG